MTKTPLLFLAGLVGGAAVCGALALLALVRTAFAALPVWACAALFAACGAALGALSRTRPNSAPALLIPLALGMPVGPERAGALLTARACRAAGAGPVEQAAVCSGVLSALFQAPLFGPAVYFEQGPVLAMPKKAVLMGALCALAGALLGFKGAALALAALRIAPMPNVLPALSEHAAITWREGAAALPLAALFALFGAYARACAVCFARMPKNAVTGAACALTAGLLGLWQPLLAGSGALRATALYTHALSAPAWTLVGLAALRLTLTPLCRACGLSGGQALPAVFAGSALGLAAARLLALSPVFCMMLGAGAVTGAVLRRPVAAVCLLLCTFPVRLAMVLVIAVLTGTLVVSVFEKRPVRADREGVL